MSTICKDCGIKGKGVHHCEQYHNMAHSIGEYQRIEAALKAKVEELEGNKDDPWTYWRRRSAQLEARLRAEECKAAVRHQTSQKTIEELQSKVEELKRELKIANIFSVSRRKVIAELQAKVEKLKKDRDD